MDCIAPDGPVHGPAQTRCSRVFQPMSAKIHRTVRAWHQTVRCTSRAIAIGHVSADQRSTGAPDSLVPPEVETNQSGDFFPCLGHVLFTVRCAPDSPVHPWTEGNNGLPNGALTASSCLGAIKGTPRRMEQHTKPPLNILRCLDFAGTHSVHRIWDLITCLRCVVCSVINLCACCCCDCSSCVCFYSLHYSCGLIVINLVRVRGSNLWRFLTKENTWWKEENCGTQDWSLDHLRGIECNPWPKEVTTTWSRHWSNHGIKSPCHLCIFFFVIVFFHRVLIYKFNTYSKGTIKWRVLSFIFTSPWFWSH
jgi:hypothetical protein